MPLTRLLPDMMVALSANYPSPVKHLLAYSFSAFP